MYLSKVLKGKIFNGFSFYYPITSNFRYLLGNQVTGESSVDAYIRALKEGCRCVECK